MSRSKPNGVAWCGIGIERPKTPANLGTLWRSAVCLGADFLFVIGDRYHRTASDTVHAPAHLPFFSYNDLDDFNYHRPHDVRLIGVELADGAKPLETFTHPKRALYLLGPEDGSLSSRALDLCSYVVSFDSRYCLNVASAGTVVLYDRRVKLSLPSLRVEREPVAS